MTKVDIHQNFLREERALAKLEISRIESNLLERIAWGLSTRKSIGLQEQNQSFNAIINHFIHYSFSKKINLLLSYFRVGKQNISQSLIT